MEQVTKDSICYKYTAVYVNDLMFTMDDPGTFEKLLQDNYHFKLKASGKIDYHIGMNFFSDENGVLCIKPSKYIEK